MTVKTLKCNSCGADLPIEQEIRFFNCSFCNSSLEVKEEEGITYLSVVFDKNIKQTGKH